MRAEFKIDLRWLIVPIICVIAPAHGARRTRPLVAASLPVPFCFIDGSSLFVQPANSRMPEKWLERKGIVDPQISPNGDAVAFTLDSTPGREKGGPVRHIAILDGKGMKARVLDGIPGSNSYGPTWSPDGNWITFQHYTGKSWEIAVIRRDGSGFRPILAPKPPFDPIEKACWSNDSKAVYCFDFDALYLVGLDGREISRIAFKDTNLEVTSGDCTFRLSPDGRQMIFQGAVDVEDIDNDGYPALVLFRFDLASKVARRISPKGVQLGQAQWLPDGKTVVCYRWDAKAAGTYLLDLDTGQLHLVKLGANNPSIGTH